MMGRETTVTSVLISIDINEVKEAQPSSIAAAFSTAEKKYLADRHIRTTAGWLAVKRAVVKLVRDGYQRDISEGDIVLDCLADGRPVISRIHSMPELAGGFFISISHTRSTAHGLAAFQEA